MPERNHPPPHPPSRGRGTLLQEANGHVSLMGSHFHDWSDYNEVAFSREFSSRMGSQIFPILGVSKDSKWENSRLKNIRKFLFIKFNNKLAMTVLHSAA